MFYKVRFVQAPEMAMREQVIEAADEQAVRLQVGAGGNVVLEVVRTAAGSRPRSGGRRHDYPLFCREVGTLIRAGMTVVEAVDTLCARPQPDRRQSRLATTLQDGLQQGQALSQALASLPDVPGVLVAAVRAGERTSNLAEALDEYLRFDELLQRLRRKVVSAAIYPALVTALGIGISLFLLVAVLPGFARMYQNLRARSGGLSAWMIEASLWVSEHRAAALGALAVLAAALALWMASGGAARFLRATAAHIPWLRDRIRDFQLAMLYQALALLLKGGYPMAQSMEIAGSAALAPGLRQALASAQGKVMEGSLISLALSANGLCDEVDRRLMAAAERNGQFHLAAEVVSRLHGERFELFVERMTRIVEPVLLLGVALMVGGIVVAMYLPVFDMATRLR